MLTITCSGPSSSWKAAQKALKAAGFAVVPDALGDPSDYDWGHDRLDGEVFLTVEHEDVNRAVEILEPLQWRLRSHRETPERPSVLSVEDRLAAIGLSAGELRTALGL